MSIQLMNLKSRKSAFMIKTLFLSSLIFLLALLAISCGDDKRESMEMKSTHPGLLWSSEIANYADAEVAIERLRKKSGGPDWTAIREQFQITLPVIRKIDKDHGLDYEREITEALALCESGQRPEVNQQILAKGLQHVTVLAIKHDLNEFATENQIKREYAIQKIIYYFVGIRPTFIRRDQDYFPKTKTLEETASAAITEILKTARYSQNIIGPRRSLEEVIARTYALSVLFEIEEIERLRASDRPKCDVKRMEVLIFYRIICDRIKKRDPEADKTIRAMLEVDYDQMNASIIEDALAKGLPNITLR